MESIQLIFTPDESERLKQKIQSNISIDSETGCWEPSWLKDKERYSQIGTAIGWYATHRVSYTVFKGIIPDGMIVCHKCDNPPCCNPEHLFVGTQHQNLLDMSNKGRGNYFTESKIKACIENARKTTKEQRIENIRKVSVESRRENGKKNRPLSNEIVINIRKDLKTNMFTLQKVADMNNCTYKQVEAINQNRTYRDIV